MPTYRKKPVEIDAIQWTGDNIEEIWDAFGAGEIYGPAPDVGRDHLEIHTLEGRMRADIGDWIIRGVKGELYPCKPDVFTATYDTADGPSAEEERDGAYRERAHLLAWLATLHPSSTVLTPAPDVDEPGWHLLYLEARGSQMSWHIAPDDVPLFRHVEHVEPDHPSAQWDGHTTEQKYARIRGHVGALADSLRSEAAVEATFRSLARRRDRILAEQRATELAPVVQLLEEIRDGVRRAADSLERTELQPAERVAEPDACSLVDVDGDQVLIRGDGPLDDEGTAALTQLVRAAQRHIAAEQREQADGHPSVPSHEMLRDLEHRVRLLAEQPDSALGTHPSSRRRGHLDAANVIADYTPRAAGADDAEARLARVEDALAGLQVDAERYRDSSDPALARTASGYSGAVSRIRTALDTPKEH